MRRRPRCEQVLGRRLGPLGVAHGDVVLGAVQDALAQQHHGGADLGEQVVVLLPQRQRAEQDAVDHAEPRVAEQAQLAFALGAGLGDQHRQPLRVRGAHDHVGQLGEVRRPQLGDDEADQPGLARPQSPRGQVGLVVQGLDRVQHPLPGGRPDVGVAVHDVRDRLDRHLGDAGDVVDGRGHGSSLVNGRSSTLQRCRHPRPGPSPTESADRCRIARRRAEEERGNTLLRFPATTK